MVKTLDRKIFNHRSENKPWMSILLLMILINLGNVVQAAKGKYAKKLVDDLFLEYAKEIRPVNDTDTAINVTFHVFLFQILELDEKNQILTAYLWLRQEWYDAHLKWTPSKYDGLEMIRLPSSKIWLPDIVLYNNADEKFTKNLQTNVILKNNGLVRWDQPAITKTSCEMDVSYFPFDAQSCPFTFGSWTFYGEQLNITPAQVEGNRDDFVTNVEWEVTAMPIERIVAKYSCCPDPYPVIDITINLRRKSMFYIFNLLLPCIFISILAPLIFYLPAESGEKVSLGVTTLLAMTVFQLLVAENMPPSQAVPLIGKYYIITMALMSLSTATTIFVQNVHFCGPNPEPVPNWIRVWILHRLAIFLGIKVHNSYSMNIDDNEKKKKQNHTVEHCNPITKLKNNKNSTAEKCVPLLQEKELQQAKRNYVNVNGNNTIAKFSSGLSNGTVEYSIEKKPVYNTPQHTNYNRNHSIKTISSNTPIETDYSNQFIQFNPDVEVKHIKHYPTCRPNDKPAVREGEDCKLLYKKDLNDRSTLPKRSSLAASNNSPLIRDKYESLASLRRKKFHQMSMYSKSLDMADEAEIPLLMRTSNASSKTKFPTITTFNDNDIKSSSQLASTSIHNSSSSVNIGDAWSVSSLNKNDPLNYKEYCGQRCRCINKVTDTQISTQQRITATNKPIQNNEKIKNVDDHHNLTRNDRTCSMSQRDPTSQKQEKENKEDITESKNKETLDSNCSSISENVKCIAEHLNRQRRVLAIADEWKSVSRVCDRALMWIFVIVQILFSTLILCKIL